MNKNDKKYFKEMIEDNDLFHVSIPMTVLGGLQHCAPEPLGLLAPDE